MRNRRECLLCTFKNGGNAHLYIRCAIRKLISFSSLKPNPLALEELTMESGAEVDEEVSVFNPLCRALEPVVSPNALGNVVM